MASEPFSSSPVTGAPHAGRRSGPTGSARSDPGRVRHAVVGLVAVVAVVTASWVAVSPIETSGAADPAAAEAAVIWLADQLDEGTYRDPLASGPDHGLMVDAVYAMAAAGRADLADPILEVLERSGGALDFVSYRSFLPGQGDDRVAGAVAKLLVVALVTDRDPRAFGGLDLVAETRAAVITDGDEAGRLADHGPNIAANSTNVFGQTLAVLGLAGAGARHDDALGVLLDQQCAAGYFRIFFTRNTDGSPATCDQAAAGGGAPPDGDATGFALQALLAARSAGTTGLDGPIDATVDWLVANQDPSGGWGGGVTTAAPNTNSTGLIVQALAAADADPTVIARGEAYLRSAQVDDDDAATPLAGHRGAIAYTPAQYDQARRSGIGSSDTWIRATTQASLGLSQVGFATLVDGAASEPPGPTTTATPTTSVPTTSAPPTTRPAGSAAPTTTAPGLQPAPPTDPTGRSDRVGRPGGHGPGGPTTASGALDPPGSPGPLPGTRTSGGSATGPARATAGPGTGADRGYAAGRTTSGDARDDTADSDGVGSGQRAHSARSGATPVVGTGGSGPDQSTGSGGGPPGWLWGLGALVAALAALVGLRLGAGSRNVS